MKSLLEIEKEITASMLAAGLMEIHRPRNETKTDLVKAIYAAMEYERQLHVKPAVVA